MVRNYKTNSNTLYYQQVRNILEKVCNEKDSYREVYVKFLRSYADHKDTCIIWLNGSPIRAYIIYKLNRTFNNLWVYDSEGKRISRYNAEINFSDFPQNCFEDKEDCK